jgi:methionyl-tRNA formyltransferase
MSLRKIKKILYLGYDDSLIVTWLKKENIIVETTLDILAPITLMKNEEKYDWVISYRYPHIITPEVIDIFSGRMVNLHISYLPWNRGADPNLWSIVEQTPKGISIHAITPGLDKGDIYCQKMFEFSDEETLLSTYEKLNQEIQLLFIEVWPDIVSNNLLAIPQKGKGCYHRKKDKEKLPAELFKKGWDITIKEVKEIMKTHKKIKQ